MNHLTGSASPHITLKANTTRNIMLDVIIALLPCLIAATFFFGYHVILNAVFCAAACFGAELLYNLIQKGFNKENAKKAGVWDLSCIVTGVLLALNLPSKVVVKGWDFNFYADGFRTGGGADQVLFSLDTLILCVIGGIFAMCLVKMLFGGIGKNFANPAAAARVFLVLCFAFTAVNTAGIGISASSGATWLSGDKDTSNISLFLNMFFGNRGSSAVGETSMIAILLGFIYLSARRVIDFRIPLIGLACFLLFVFVIDGIIARQLYQFPDAGAKLLNNVFANLMAGGFVFGLVFMATDYSTTPNTFWGHAIFVGGYAFFTVLIRSFGGLPEGASFALLIMNICAPLLDRYLVPKPFGYVKERKLKKTKKLGAEVKAL